MRKIESPSRPAPAPTTENELLETIADAGIGTWQMHLPNRLLNLSRTGLDLLGNPSPIPRTWSELLGLVHAEDREHVSQVLEDSLESGNDLAIDFRVHLPFGKVRWLRQRAAMWLPSREHPDG